MSNKAKSLYIISKSPKPVTLKVNEGVSNEGSLASNKSYILEGVFGVVNAESNRPNRNDRIYDESEYLPHIQEFREELSKGIPVLGELDHPMDGPDGPRFEVLLKNASHRILDVWYDKQKKLVMGRLEILNTPNGNIVKALIDAGVPIYVSSRAAGYVNPNKHVTIKKIYTWDIVAKPGFEEAQVRMVNESLCESYNAYLDNINYGSGPKDMSIKYNISDKNTSIYEVAALDNTITGEPLKLVRPEDPDKLTPHTHVEPQLKDTSAKLGSLSKINAIACESEDEEKENEKKDSPIKSIDYEKDVQDETVILKIKPKFYNTLSGKEKDAFDKNEKEKEEKKRMSKSESYEALIKKYEEKEKANESIMEKYPWISVLRPDQLEYFTSLDESTKEKMTELVYNKYFDSMSPLFESANRKMQETTFRSLYRDAVNAEHMYSIMNEAWFALAPEKYKEYYMNSAPEVQANIQRQANYFIFEDAADVERFWSNNIVDEKTREEYLNEKDEFIYRVPQSILNEMIREEEENTLGYSPDEIAKTEALLESYRGSQYTDLFKL